MTQDKRITTVGIGSFGESGEIDNERSLRAIPWTMPWNNPPT